MRASSVWLLLCSLTCGSLGCGVQDKPEPHKLERTSPFARDIPRPPRDPNSPLRNPAHETPSGPDGEQVSDEEIEAALAEAATFAAANDVTQQQGALRKCANKTPPSPRCDGEMGLSMADIKQRRATGLYFLISASQVDDPKADASLYRRVGEALRRHGKQAEAVAALELAVAREPSGEHLFLLGQALSLVPDRLPDAADRMAEARSKDDRIAWLHDEAVLRGQIPTREQAAAALALFRQYAERAPSVPAGELPTPVAGLEQRMTELEFLAKQYPTQAEYEAKQAAAAAAPTVEPDPAVKADPDKGPS